MDFLKKASYYLSNNQNLRRGVFISIAIIFLLVVVLFNSDIQNLLNRPGAGKAAGPIDSLINWSHRDDLDKIEFPRSNAKMIDVVQNGGERWLYLIGGTETILDDEAYDQWFEPTGGSRLSLVSKVERMRINPDGSPKENEIWQPAKEMNFGHAEFGLIEYDDYIYVISGDIHAPEVDDEDNEFPLLYSTIERLPLNDMNSEWQVVALISGLNFYPEIKIYNDQLHIVGGIYGNPFRSSTTYSIYGNYSAKDPLVLGGDNWDSIKDKPVIGDILLVVGVGGLEQSIISMDNPTPPIMTPFGMSGNNMTTYVPDLNTGLMIQQVDPGAVRNNIPGLPPWYPEDFSNFNLLFSQLLLNGEFYTTVSEHYILDLNPDGSLTSIADELDSDYKSDEPLIENIWAISRVIKIGHLRVILSLRCRSDDDYYLTISPAPQGRYGHKLIVNKYKDPDEAIKEDLLVIGGASWSNPHAWGRCYYDEGEIPTSYTEISYLDIE